MKLQAIYFHDFNNSHIPEILEETYLKKVYEPILLGKKDLIIGDWGGNIGLTSFYFKDFGHVYTAEPSTAHLEALRAMIKQNEITNITVCPYAISNKNGKEKLYLHNNNTSNSLIQLPTSKNFEEVETVTPEEFFKRNKLEKLDFLKWDTEGNESEIIVSDSFKNIAPKIKAIGGEYHDWTSMNKLMFKRAFEDLGYVFNWNFKTQASTYIAVRL